MNNQRQRLFRVWDAENNKMVYDGTLCFAQFCHGFDFPKDNSYLLRFDGIESGEMICEGHFSGPVMEWTGLFSKEGSGLYEEDLVRHNGKIKRVVHSLSYNWEGASPESDYTRDFLSCYGMTDGRTFEAFMWINRTSEYVEKIGSIYENPELWQM